MDWEQQLQRKKSFLRILRKVMNIPSVSPLVSHACRPVSATPRSFIARRMNGLTGGHCRAVGVAGGW